MAVYTENLVIAANTLAAIQIRILQSQKDRVFRHAVSGANFPSTCVRSDLEFDILNQVGLERMIGPHCATWATADQVNFGRWDFAGRGIEVPPPDTSWTIRSNIFNNNAASVSFFMALITEEVR